MTFMTGGSGDEAEKGYAKCFLFSPLWIPLLPFALMYLNVVFVPTLKRFKKALVENSTSEIKLTLSGASSCPAPRPTSAPLVRPRIKRGGWGGCSSSA